MIKTLIFGLCGRNQWKSKGLGSYLETEVVDGRQRVRWISQEKWATAGTFHVVESQDILMGERVISLMFERTYGLYFLFSFPCCGVYTTPRLAGKVKRVFNKIIFFWIVNDDSEAPKLL